MDHLAWVLEDSSFFLGKIKKLKMENHGFVLKASDAFE